jgi:hypothetical protein
MTIVCRNGGRRRWRDPRACNMMQRNLSNLKNSEVPMFGSPTHAAPGPGPDAHAQLMQISIGYMPSACLYAATKLKIADLLAGGPKSLSDLARSSQANEDALYRSLRAIASLGIFRETTPRTFANTPLSEALRTGAPGSARDTVLFLANPLHFRVFGEFMHPVKTGGTAFQKVTGMDAFQFFEHQNEESEAFNAAMTAITENFTKPLIATYDFGETGTLADIGGGHGALLAAILKKHPGLRGIVFDVPHVVAGAEPRMTTEGLGSRCEVIGGDFFQSVPPADSYIMKSIIHDWDDARAIVILKNCAAAMRSRGGKIILVEMVMSSGNEPDLAKWIDMEMLAMGGGRERTETEFAELFAKAGLRLARVVRTPAPACLIEAVKV